MDFFGTKRESNKSFKSNAIVDNAHLDYLWSIRYTNATVGACCAYLTSRLLGLGFYYESQNRKTATSEFKAHVNKHFLPFAKKALDAFLVQGFVVFNVHKPTDSQYPIPFVLGQGSYDVHMHVSDRGLQSIKVTEKNGKKRKGVYFHVLDLPTDTGVCTSKVSLVSKSISYVEEVEKLDLQSFSVRARPPVLTRTKTDNTFDSRDVISGSIPGLRAQDENDNIALRNRITIAQTRMQQELIKTLNDKRVDSSGDFWASQMNPSERLGSQLRRDVDEYAPRFIPLPNDADVAKYEMPEEKHNLHEVWRHVKDQICMGMGVPESFLRASASGGSATGLALKTMEDFIRLTTSPLQQSLGDLLARVFAVCFENDDLVSCRFPAMVNCEQLLDLYKDGLLKKSSLSRLVAPIYGLEITDMITDEDDAGEESAKKRRRINEREKNDGDKAAKVNFDIDNNDDE